MSTLNNESSHNEVVISRMLNKESALRRSNEETPQIVSHDETPLIAEREESEKSIGTMILREAKEEEPSVHEEEDIIEKMRRSTD